MQQEKYFQSIQPAVRRAVFASLALMALLGTATAQEALQPACQRTIVADVIALDQVFFWNRLGAMQPQGMMFALSHDVFPDGADESNILNSCAHSGCSEGRVHLREGKRPRPLVLRMNVKDCLRINFRNLLNPMRQDEEQVATRDASVHVIGLQLVKSILDDGSNVGKVNQPPSSTTMGSLVAPGKKATYTLYAEREGQHVLYSAGATTTGEGDGGQLNAGLFGAVNVEPRGADWLRSQVTAEDVDLALDIGNPNQDPLNPGHTKQGHPIINYDKTYPLGHPRAGLPIFQMLQANKIKHSDLTAVIAGPFSDLYPENPVYPVRDQSFREVTIIYHDEIGALQAFPELFDEEQNPVMAHTLHSVRDSFALNYGTGGIGAEIVANRLAVGPMRDCLGCKYEEFFLASWTVGDPAMVVDTPANACVGVLNCRAEEAKFPDDPSNVYHSYLRDHLKFRILHGGSKEHHIHHQHTHQWLYAPDSDESAYLDSQALGPGASFTLEMVHNGSGNRNAAVGDSIFHCHFYPHFAQGMWELWRVHDTAEVGTELAVSAGGIHTVPFALKDGTPAASARALPDGEIIAGTPIPGVVPLPGKAMAPMPGRVEVVAKNANPGVDDDPLTPGVQEFAEASAVNVIDRNINPGFPFWIAGVDCGGPGKVNPLTGQCDDGIVGQRPTTPALDMLSVADATALSLGTNPLFSGNANLVASAGGFDGGLPRHSLEGFKAVESGIPGRADPDIVVQNQTRFDFRKVLHKAKPVYFPEEGTDLEQAAMDFHAQLNHSTYLPDGSLASFRTNGSPPVAGAPYNEPCIDDKGAIFESTTMGAEFFASPGFFFYSNPDHGADNPRVYKAANIQIDAVFNKVGYHFPQQRIITLWGDVMPTVNNVRPPEPFVIRMNTFDCTQYYHSNLVPSEYELDDYQVRTPTDIIGQHIHLPKWDLVSADGSGNGWNYEDGTLSPQAVIERIEAINHFNDDPAFADIPTIPKPDGSGAGLTHLTPATHADPDFPTAHALSLGARTTIQRWFADPVVNISEEDRGLGIIFTHDHYGPSTHQQVGLYATVLTEPSRSIWKHNETGVLLATRGDGGPTSWQAIVEPTEATGDGQIASAEPFREFYFEFADFQHAYEAGAAGIIGADNCTAASCPGFEDTFRSAINPSVREEVPFPDAFRFPALCPGGVPRPCPEAISAEDVGMWVVNYRNEPVGLRVFDPQEIGPDGKPGTQAVAKDVNLDTVIDAGEAVRGDLAFALATHVADKVGNLTPIPRAIAEMNLDPQTADLQFWTTTLNAGGGLPGDPFTPMLRTYPGDLVRVKIQTGATEEEHNATIHGVKWLQGGSGHGAAPNSGWRNAQEAGISEQFTFSAPISGDPQRLKGPSDYAYSVDASTDGWWSGMWGIMRNYDSLQPDLEPLTGGFTKAPLIENADDFVGVCPAANPGAPLNNRVPANLREYTVIAIAANELLGNSLGVTIPDNQADPVTGLNDNEGGPLDPNGGTLVYNPRSTTASFQGPLHDPTAILFVNLDDLEPLNGFKPNGKPVDAACDDFPGQNPIPGLTRADCPVKLKAGVKPEPLVLRAAAGDCIETTLFNRLPGVASDLAGFSNLIGIVPRDQNDPLGVTTFNNNLVRPSSYAGLHAQLVEYDVTQHDGACVGVNACLEKDNVAQSPTLDAQGKLKVHNVTYRWYAGKLDHLRVGSPSEDRINIVATPVELGGTNLMPADTVKQGQKGMVGSLIIEPQGSAWAEDAGQRAAASVGPDSNADGVPDSTAFRDFAVIFQRQLNLRYSDGSPVENIGDEEGESEDSGQSAINYGTEPAWYRFGKPANVPFGNGIGELGAQADAHKFYSNTLAGGDPFTPVFTAFAGVEARMRVLMPTGAARGTTFDLHGHMWQRDPYLAGTVPSQTIGINPLAMYLGHQESVLPAAHFDIFLPKAGGAFWANLGCTAEQPCDFLYRDHGSFGTTNGLWGILRVVPAPLP